MAEQGLNDSLPDRERLMQALLLVGSSPDGEPLDVEQLALAQDAQLVGMLDAAVERVAERFCSGRGKSQRFLIVNGYRQYLRTDGNEARLMQFFQSRLARLAGDMQSALNVSSTS
jgi:hypothetical protein